MIPRLRTSAHIVAMSDGIGTFEHAEYSVPRVAEGYCTDDMARVLIAVVPASRSPTRRVVGLGAHWRIRFLVDAQGVDGKVRNRRSAGGRWRGRRVVEDCWGRADVGVRHRRSTGARGLDASERGVVVRPRARTAHELATCDGVRRARRSRADRRRPTSQSGHVACSRTLPTPLDRPAPIPHGRGRSHG